MHKTVAKGSWLVTRLQVSSGASHPRAKGASQAAQVLVELLYVYLVVGMIQELFYS